MTDPKSSDLVALLATQQGLSRMLERFPEAVAAAAERGLKPLGAPPAGTPDHLSPAAVFDPEAAARP